MKSRNLAAPYIAWMALFTVIPLGVVVYFAFTDSITGSFTLGNITRMGSYFPIFLRSVWLALVASVVCLLVGYHVE